MFLTALALAVILCGSDQVAFTPPPEAEIAAIKERLTPIQQLSFATGYEYCGYLGHDAQKRIQFTDMQRGKNDSCTPIVTDAALHLVASLHTHGAYDRDVPAEFPTVRDMRSDASEGVNGYIGTPGGRLWYIDSKAMVAVQLCGLGCLPQDPAFHAGDDGEIQRSYTLQELMQLEAQDL
ncbi:MAG: DUF4329 domain-containing protein [Rhodobacteraceae bacterium]|nr:DUF4329 domain-containing protein [Paracoccaceae bacterium]